MPWKPKVRSAAVKSKPLPNIPPQREWDLNGGAMVRCARCSRERLRGAACQCERFDCEGHPATRGAAVRDGEASS